MNNIKTLVYFLFVFAYLTLCCNAECPTGTYPVTGDNLNTLAATYGIAGYGIAAGFISGCCYGFGFRNCTALNCTGGSLHTSPSSTALAILDLGARTLSAISFLTGLGLSLGDSAAARALGDSPVADVVGSLASSASAGLGHLAASVGLGDLVHSAANNVLATINLILSLGSLDELASGFRDGGALSDGIFICCGCGEKKKN